MEKCENCVTNQMHLIIWMQMRQNSDDQEGKV